MHKLLSILMGATLAIAVVGTPMLISSDAEARRMSSSSSSFSRGSFRASTPRITTTRAKATTTGFWSSPGKGTKGKKVGSIKTKQKTHSVRTSAQSKRTKQAVKARQQKAVFKGKSVTPPGITSTGKTPPSRLASNRAYRSTYNSNPVYNRARGYDNSTYYDRRNRYVGDYDPPIYVQSMAPSYGMFDTIVMLAMLDSITDNNHAAQMAYHQQNNADYKAWRAEADKLAAENAALATQLKALDAQTAKMAGTKIDPSKLPEGVDADILLSSGALQSVLPELKVCTGSEKGAYFLTTAGVIAPNISGINVVPVPTAGTGEALSKISKGECDAAWVQSDGYWNYIEDNETIDLPFTRVLSPYREAVHVICHEDGPSKISKLGEEHKLWFPSGSGAAVTFRNWIGEDDDYAEIQTVLTETKMEVESNTEALSKVYNDPTKKSCMMYVGAPKTKFMRQVEQVAKAKKIVLIDINDGDFDDTEDPSGADVYDFMQIDSSVYPNLSRQAGVVYGSGDIHTLDMNADLLVSTKWQKKHKKIFPDLELNLASLEQRIKAVVKPR